MTREIWKDAPGWEGMYAVSNLGRVKSLDRTVCSDSGEKRTIRGRIMKTPPDGRGYSHCNFHRCGKKTCVYPHQLVAEAFRGPCPPGQEVRHLDGNRANPRLINLRYGTCTQNHADNIVHGTTNRGERNGQVKLTRTAVRSIRRRYAAGGISQQALGEEYGITQTTVGDLVRRKRWGWLI